MTKAAELAKAAERGQELTDAEVALEDARAAFHKDRKPATRQAMREAAKVVQAERRAAREAREAAGSPADAMNVMVDQYTGKVHGWNNAAGDVFVSPGGVSQ